MRIPKPQEKCWLFPSNLLETWCSNLTVCVKWKLVFLRYKKRKMHRLGDTIYH